jgi:hypothetical protein
MNNSFDEVKIVRRRMETLAEAPLQKLKNAGCRRLFLSEQAIRRKFCWIWQKGGMPI